MKYERKQIMRPDLAGYSVTNLGEVYNQHGQLVKPWIDARGKATVTVNGKWHVVDRLIATEFCDNTGGYMFVRHLDGDETNCRANNLQWYGEPLTSQKIEKAEECARRVLARENGGLYTEDRINHAAINTTVYDTAPELEEGFDEVVDEVRAKPKREEPVTEEPVTEEPEPQEEETIVEEPTIQEDEDNTDPNTIRGYDHQGKRVLSFDNVRDFAEYHNQNTRDSRHKCAYKLRQIINSDSTLYGLWWKYGGKEEDLYFDKRLMRDYVPTLPMYDPNDTEGVQGWTEDNKMVHRFRDVKELAEYIQEKRAPSISLNDIMGNIRKAIKNRNGFAYNLYWKCYDEQLLYACDRLPRVERPLATAPMQESHDASLSESEPMESAPKEAEEQREPRDEVKEPTPTKPSAKVDRNARHLVNDQKRVIKISTDDMEVEVVIKAGTRRLKIDLS